MSTPTNWTPWLAYLAASAFNPGCSFRQGPHHAAQNTTTVLDALKSTASAAPSRVAPESCGATAPTRAWGAAWETSGCSVHPASSSSPMPKNNDVGLRPSKLVDRAGLGVGQGSPEPEAGRRGPRGRRQQGLVEDFGDVLHEDELHGTLDFVGNLVQVFAILLGQDERLDPGPMRRQQLFFQPTNRQHFPA